VGNLIGAFIAGISLVSGSVAIITFVIKRIRHKNVKGTLVVIVVLTAFFLIGFFNFLHVFDNINITGIVGPPTVPTQVPSSVAISPPTQKPTSKTASVGTFPPTRDQAAIALGVDKSTLSQISGNAWHIEANSDILIKLPGLVCVDFPVYSQNELSTRLKGDTQWIDVKLWTRILMGNAGGSLLTNTATVYWGYCPHIK